MISITIKTADDMQDFGATCSRASHLVSSIYLLGDLGAGKTTFVRGFLTGLGHEGAVKSPTYTLVESYTLDGKTIHHFDLYRLNQAEELEAIGVRDYFENAALCLLEWPEKAEGFLPDPDIMIDLEYDGEGRQGHIKALSDQGVSFLTDIKNNLPA